MTKQKGMHIDSKQIRNAVNRLIAQYPLTERPPLVMECADWNEIITPAFAAWASLLPIDPDPQKAMLQWHLHNAMTAMIESVYVMGYERGRREPTMPEFVVAEEVEA